MAARQTDRESSDAGRQATRKAADQTARSGRAIASVAARVGRAGAEAAEHSSERGLSSWRSGTHAANQIAEQSLDRLTKMFGLTGDTARQALQQSSGNVQAMLETATIISDGLQDLSGEWLRFVQDRAQQNLEHFDRLLQCRSLQEWMALQTQIVRDHFEALLESARKTSERSTLVADEAVRKMSETGMAVH